MKEVSEYIYSNNFTNIFKWFKEHVHAAPEEEYLYKIIDLPGTHLKMVDIIRELTEGVYFRVILKSTYDDVKHPVMPPVEFEDLSNLFNTKTIPAASPITGTQVCFIQLNGDNQPMDAVIFTYSPHDEKYHTFHI